MKGLDFSLSRRQLIGGAAAGGALALMHPASLLAKAPMIGQPAPYYYRFKFGDAEATVVSDGTLPLGNPHTNFLGLTPDGRTTRSWPARSRTPRRSIRALAT